MSAAGKMDVRSFGDALIATRDLDPVYVGLVGARLPEPQLYRWLLAYWCFYHVGSASWLSELEGEDFWANMTDAALNQVAAPVGGRWPRAAERRHFRGQKCVDSVVWLQREFEQPENPVKHLVNDVRGAGLSDKLIMGLVQEWPMFGPWIAFKAADMMERVYGAKVSFDHNLGLMYEEPRKALDLISEVTPGTHFDGRTANDHYKELLGRFERFAAPPRLDRPCGPQEVETVLCKWKSYMGGHYHIGKDIHEQRAALAGWGATADRILAAYPPEVGLPKELGENKAETALYNETMRTP